MPTGHAQPTDRLNTTTWDTYARQRLPSEQPRGDPPPLWWTPWPNTGPGPGILGPLTGRHALELGCGAGDNAAALAAAGATVTAVDTAPAMIQRARLRWGHIPRLHTVTADAAAYLRHESSGRFDLACSIFGALTFSPPHQLLPLLATRLRPGGQLAVATRLPATASPAGAIEQAWLALPDQARAPLVRHALTATQWTALLHQHGFTTARAIEIDHPHSADMAGCLIIIATAQPRQG